MDGTEEGDANVSGYTDGVTMAFGIKGGTARIMSLLRACVCSGNGEELRVDGGSGMLISACSCPDGPSLEDNKGMTLAEDSYAEMSALPCLRLSDAGMLAAAVAIGGEERDGAGTWVS